MTNVDQQIRAVLNGYDHDAAGQIDHLTGAIRAVLELHPVIEAPRHGCCAPPQLCKGHPPECGGKDHGIDRPRYPCRTIHAIAEKLELSSATGRLDGHTQPGTC